MQFKGKTALITGAASGMGLQFSVSWASEGGNVIMCDVNEPVLREKADEITRNGPGKAVPCVCDVRDYAQITAARDLAVKEFSAIDVSVSFAGGTAVRVCQVDGARYPEFPDVPIEIYDWGLDVNLRAQLYVAHAVMKQMRDQKGGLVVNIGSSAGEEGDSYGVEYAAAKSGAMYGLTRSLAQYGAQYGIRCVCVSPGPVLTRPAMAGMKTMVGRAADPQEIVDLILYIASDKGAFINGANIIIDGGRTAMDRRHP